MNGILYRITNVRLIVALYPMPRREAPEIAIKHLNICNVDERDSSMSFAFQLCLLHVIEAPSYQ